MPLSLTGLGGGAASLFRAGGGAGLFDFNSFTFLSGDESFSSTLVSKKMFYEIFIRNSYKLSTYLK